MGIRRILSLRLILCLMNNYKQIKKLQSKKNQVYLVEDNDKKHCILKRYTNIKSKEIEKKSLLQLFDSGVRVPKLYYVGEDYIIMEYIQGINLADHLWKLEKEKKSCVTLMIDLSYQLKQLYNTNYFSKNDLILYDVNLRNLLVTSKGFCFIDLEDVQQGVIISDIAGILAYFMTNDPPNSPWKIECFYSVFQLYCQIFEMPQSKLSRLIQERFRILEKRRDVKYQWDIFDMIKG